MLGQTCAVRFDMQRQAAVAVGVNAWSPHARDSVVRHVMTLLGCELPVPDAHADFTAAQLAPDLHWDALPGLYHGSYLGEVRVSAEGEGLLFEAGPPGPRRSIFRIRFTPSGLYAIESRAPLSVSFTRTSRQDVALILGVHSYKKID
jgi:hypothetical protein